jgi:hypothetical protein
MPALFATESPPSPEVSLEHSLRWIARLACGTTIFATLLALGGIAYFIVDPEPALHLFGPRGAFETSAKAGLAIDRQSTRFALLLALLPALILFLLTAHGIYRLFHRFGQGRILDSESARQLGNIGWFLFASAEVAILTRTLVVLALTWNNPPGQRQLAISISLNDFMLLLFGLFVLAFAQVIKEAARIADENRGFV